jgi:hypothetical protein
MQSVALDRQAGVLTGLDLLVRARDVLLDQLCDAWISRLRHRPNPIGAIGHGARDAIVVHEQFVDGGHLRHGAGIVTAHHARAHTVHHAARRRPLHHARVPGLVIFDLEVQKRVDRGERIRITRDDPHTPAGGRLLVAVGNAVLESCHVHGPRHLLRVGQSRLAEVSRFE